MNDSLRALDGLLETLEAAPRVLAGLVSSIPPGRLDRRRKPHFWTIREHIEHLATVQPMLMGRIERFRDEERPNFTPYHPSDPQPPSEAAAPPRQPVEQTLEEFRDWRTRQLGLIRDLPPEVWEKRTVHPEFEEYGAEILVRHIAMHDHWHMYRIEELWITKDEFLTEVE